jgi:hypothetical protein
LDFNANIKIKDALRAARSVGYLPMAFSDVKQKMLNFTGISQIDLEMIIIEVELSLERTTVQCRVSDDRQTMLDDFIKNFLLNVKINLRFYF